MKRFHYLFLSVLISLTLGIVLVNARIPMDGDNTEIDATDNPDYFLYTEYNNLLNELKIAGQFKFNIEAKKDFFLSLPEDFKNVKLLTAIEKKSASLLQAMDTDNFQSFASDTIKTLLENIFELRIHEILTAPFNETGHITQNIANIIATITLDPAVLEGGFVLPPPNFNQTPYSYLPTEGQNQGQRASLFQTGKFSKIKLDDNLCSTYYCLTLDIQTRQRRAKSTRRQDEEDLQLAEQLDQTNKDFQTLNGQNLSLRCINQQTFGGRFYENFNFLKIANLHIIYSGFTDPERPPLDEPKLNSAITDVQAYDKVLEQLQQSSPEADFDINTYRDKFNELQNRDETGRKISLINQEFANYKNLSGNLGNIINFVSQIETLIRTTSENILRDSLELSSKQQATQ